MDIIVRIAQIVFWIVAACLAVGFALVWATLLNTSRTQIEIERLLRDDEPGEPYLRVM